MPPCRLHQAKGSFLAPQIPMTSLLKCDVPKLRRRVITGEATADPSHQARSGSSEGFSLHFPGSPWRGGRSIPSRKDC